MVMVLVQWMVRKVVDLYQLMVNPANCHKRPYTYNSDHSRRIREHAYILHMILMTG